jgi:hypothetical protein
MPISIPASPGCERGRKRAVRTGTPRPVGQLRLALRPHSLGSSRSIARFCRTPLLSGLNSQPASS